MPLLLVYVKMINIILFDDMLNLEFSLYRAMLLSTDYDIDAIVEGRRRLADLRMRRLDYINNVLPRDGVHELDDECLEMVSKLYSSILLVDKYIRAFIVKWPVEIAIRDRMMYRTAVATFLDRMSWIMNWQSRIVIDVISRNKLDKFPQPIKGRALHIGEWCRCKSYMIFARASN